MGPEMPERGSKTSMVPVAWANFGIFFARRDPNDLLSRLVAMDEKPGYITMTRRQSNNQWSDGIAALPAPKIPSVKIHWKSSRLDFLVSRRHPPNWLSSKVLNYQRGVLLVSSGGIEGCFEGKMPREYHQRGSCSCTTMPRLTWHLQPRRNWPTWASSFLITHPILRIWPCWTTTCSLDWKKQLKVRHFSSDVEIIAAAETLLDGRYFEFFFLNGLQKLEQRAKSVLSFVGNELNKSWVWSL